MKSKITSWLYDTRDAEDHLKVACVTMSIERDPEENLIKIGDQVDDILHSHADIDLIVFGEMLFGWFNPGKMPEYHRGIARPIAKEILEPLMIRCINYGIYLCFGMPEKNGELFFNTQVLINPQGEIQTIHRKYNLKPGEEMANYQAGSVPLTITNIKGAKTGIVICADAAHPKTIWALVKNRLDMVIISLADDHDQGSFMAKFNAHLYDAWVVTANRYGDEDSFFWNGHAVISDPLGVLRTISKDKAGVLVYDIKFDRNQNILKLLLRNFLVKASLLGYLMINLKRIKDYR